MKTLRLRDQLTVADPLPLERVLQALTIMLAHQEAPEASSLLGARLDQSATTRRDHRASTTRPHTSHSAP
jgi:hypothetical protein